MMTAFCRDAKESRTCPFGLFVTTVIANQKEKFCPGVYGAAKTSQKLNLVYILSRPVKQRVASPFSAS